VASVKKTSTNALDLARNPAKLGRVDNLRVNLTFRSIPELVARAYGVNLDDVQCPDRFQWPRFDIDAKMPAGASKSQIPRMLQSLLSERFKLIVHKELRPSPFYSLTVAPGGPALKESAAGSAPRCSVLPCGGLSCQRMTIDELAKRLSTGDGPNWTGLDAPIADSTNLTGRYDFILEFDFVSSIIRRATPTDCVASGQSIHSALRALGLTLARKKENKQREYIVIDGGLLTPTEN